MNETVRHASDGARIEIRIVPDAEMPDGLNAVLVERDGTLALCIRDGEIGKQAAAEANAGLRHIAAHGLWEQAWGGPKSPLEGA